MSIAGDIRAAYAHLRTSGGLNVKTVLEHGPSYLAARLREGREGFDRKHRTETSMRKTTIYAGSNEIQRNIIAKATLGL